MALLAVVIFGPDKEDVERTFEFLGAQGELEIMPELSVDDGNDEVYQLPEFFQDTPPPAPMDIIEDEPDPDAIEEMPVVEELSDTPNDIVGENVNVDPDLEAVDLVELTLPQQVNRDWRIIHMVRPNYPIDATEIERRTPVISVVASVFVDPSGDVTAAMITNSTGGPAFTEVALKAVRQWVFEWRIEEGRPQVGRWINIPWNFKSPYYSGG